MKKVTVFTLALSLALSLCACSKASRIPSLAEIAENGAEWGGEQIRQVQGCTLADLEKAWGEADGELPGEYAYFWKVDDTTSVNVYYHRNAEIEHITVTSADDEQQTAPADPAPNPHRCLWRRWAAATLIYQTRTQKRSCISLTPAAGCPMRRIVPAIMC